METLNIEIKNPKAKKILNSLAELDLISIRKLRSFNETLLNFRNNSKNVPTFEEITNEVEIVRQSRYAKKA